MLMRRAGCRRANYSNNDGSCPLRFCWTGIHICGIIIYTYYGDSMPVRSRSNPPKLEALREEGTLNPTPDEVHDPKFQENEFFDPHDIVQVKYEMLRRVSVENASVSAATEEYGVSRPTYYQTKASFDKGGVAGLVPQKRGPRGPHKLRGQSTGIRPGATRYGRARASARARQAGSAEVRSQYPPQNDRESGRRKKNSPMSSANNNSRSHPWS